MKFSNITKLLCLFLSLILVMGCMMGCQQSQSESRDESSPSPTESTAAPNATGIFPVESNPTWADPWADGNSFDITPNDPYYELNHHWALEQIGLPNAWDITTGSNAIRVGVIDSGVDISHPDLQNCVNKQ